MQNTEEKLIILQDCIEKQECCYCNGITIIPLIVEKEELLYMRLGKKYSLYWTNPIHIFKYFEEHITDKELLGWDDEGKQVWKTKSQYFVWLRGNLRRIWSDYPLRKIWKKEQLRPVTKMEKLEKKFHTSTKNVGQCYYCKEWFAGSKLECDHVEESEGCFDFETAEQFLWHCAADNGDNWVLTCKPCHKCKTHQSKKGFSTLEEARADKAAIEICKKDEKKWLQDRGIVPESNAKKRREQVFKYLIEEKVYE